LGLPRRPSVFWLVVARLAASLRYIDYTPRFDFVVNALITPSSAIAAFHPLDLVSSDESFVNGLSIP
jgi:hypothetical protein